MPTKISAFYLLIINLLYQNIVMFHYSRNKTVLPNVGNPYSGKWSGMNECKILLIGLIIMMSLSSCLEISETLIIHEDRSGQMRMRIEPEGDLGGFGALLGLTGEFMAPLEKEFRKNALLLEDVDGISQVRFSGLESGNRLELEFGFESPKALNRAFYRLAGVKGPRIISYIRVNRCGLKRKNISPLVKRYLKKNEEHFVPGAFAGMISYSTEIRVPQKIRKFRCVRCELSGNGKRLYQRLDAGRIAENDVSTRIRVRY